MIVTVAAKCKASPAATNTHVAAAEPMTTAKATPVATTTGMNQRERAACFAHWLLLGATKIDRLCERGSSGKSKRKSTDKTRCD
jgi:hypothetical protein